MFLVEENLDLEGRISAEAAAAAACHAVVEGFVVMLQVSEVDAEAGVHLEALGVP